MGFQEITNFKTTIKNTNMLLMLDLTGVQVRYGGRHTPLLLLLQPDEGALQSVAVFIPDPPLKTQHKSLSEKPLRLS